MVMISGAGALEMIKAEMIKAETIKAGMTRGEMTSLNMIRKE